MKTIVLYGELGKRFGKYHRFAVRNAAEALRALKANFQGFESYMCGAHTQGVGFRVFIGRDGLNSVDDIHNPSGELERIRIVPVLMGAKSPLVKIIIGAVLIAAAIFTGGSSLAFLPGALGSMGASMIIGGVATLLSGSPETPKDPKRQESYLFNGPANASAQGKAIPVGYGRMIIGSIVISAGIETHEEPLS